MEDLAEQLEKYIRTPENAITFPIHKYKKNDMSYFPKDEQGEIEVNAKFNKNGTYALTISREDKPKTKITLETIFSDSDPEKLDCKAMLEQNRRELVKFLAKA